jgi:hypothetical protein
MGARASLALRPRLRRLLAALWLAAFVASGLFEVHHRASVDHFVCPADGALAHGDHRHGADGALDREAPDSTSGPELAALPDDGGHGAGHAEHCGLSELGQASELDFAAPAAPLPPRCDAPRARLAAGAPAHASVSRLSLAPKQSPPRAG